MTPISRTAERDGDRLRVYPQSCPHFYKNAAGELLPVKIALEGVDAKTGPILLCAENVASVGVRADARVEKYVGIRPDETQASGSQQIEWTLQGIEFNGLPIDPDIGNPQNVAGVADFGNVLVKADRNCVRQMVRVGDVDIRDFKITYRLELKGFHVENSRSRKVGKLREAISFADVAILDIGRVTGAQYHDCLSAFSVPAILIGHITDNHIFISAEQRPDEFGELPKDWTTSQESFPGGSMFVRDNIAIVAKGLGQADKTTLARMLINIVQEIFGAEDYDWNYSHLPGRGKSIGYSWDVKEEAFWLLINTADVSDVAPYFRSKEFNDVDFVPTIYPAFVAAFAERLAMRNCAAVSLSGEYYEPIEGQFLLASDDGKLRYAIPLPALLDENFHVVSAKTLHTLRDNGDGSFEYVKRPSVGQVLLGFDGVAFIDSTVFYSTVADGGAWVNIAPTWAGAHDAATGTGASHLDVADRAQVSCHNVKGIKYNLYRGFSFFDTSGIGAQSIDSGAFKFTSYSSGSGNVCIQKGTQADPLTSSDFSAFTGSLYGSCAASAVDVQMSISLNAQGLADINKTGTTKLCVREYDHDYLNVAPALEENIGAFWYSADHAVPAQDPYLELVLSSFQPRGQGGSGTPALY
jgi:hypothetical protein